MSSYRKVERGNLPEMVLVMTVDRPNGKGFNLYFSSLEHLSNFVDMIETLAENARAAGAKEASRNEKVG